MDNEPQLSQPKEVSLSPWPFLQKNSLTEVLWVILSEGIQLPQSRDQLKEVLTIQNFVLSMR
jgi:hypothetical protein